MATVNSGDISAFIQTIYEDAQAVTRESAVMANLVRTFNDRTGVADRSVSEYGAATVNTIGEDTDLDSQAYTPSVVNTLSVSEFGAQFFITDLRRESDPFGVQGDAALELGSAFADKLDTELLAAAADFSKTVGTAGTGNAVSDLFAAASILRNGKAPVSELVAVLHPYQWHTIANGVTTAGGQLAGSPAMQDDIATNAWVGKIAGINVFVSSNVPVDGNDDACGVVFARPALGLDIRRAFRLESERDASRRGTELNATAVFGVGVLKDAWGVKVIGDATEPGTTPEPPAEPEA